MAPWSGVKIAGVVIFLFALNQVQCQVNGGEKICLLNITYNANDETMRISNSTSMDLKLPTQICCEGYIFNEILNCNSNCTSKCMPGYCLDSDKTADCNCYANYNLTDPSQCLPNCKNQCPTNEICTAPDICTCNERTHSKDNRTGLCVPTACFNLCKNGYCDASGVCTCKSIDSPNITMSCVNGECDDKGVCRCLTRYEEVESRPGLCVPKSCKENCYNGTCTSNGICVCGAGMILIGNNSCVDQNNSTISNQEFNAEDEEQSTTVMTLQNVTFVERKAPCNDLNGTCFCDRDSVNGSDTKCEVICPSLIEDNERNKTLCRETCNKKGCDAHEKCSDLGACDCVSGYMRDESGRCIQINCPASVDNNFCYQNCLKTCQNGMCDGKGNCKCNDGYKLDSEGRCIPTCTMACPYNEVCSSPEMCTCKVSHFKMNPGENCVEKCSTNQSCFSGRCGMDGKCTCYTGYNINTKNRCVPVCDNKCPDGSTCGAPNKCVCKAGYVMNDVKKCVAFCHQGCKHGKCVAPGRCVCDKGYPLYKGKCQEQCHQDDSCTWKLIAKNIGKGFILIICIVILAVFLVWKRRRMVLLPTRDVETTNFTCDKLGKIEDIMPEENGKEDQTTKITCLSYVRKEEGCDTDTASSSREDKVKSSECITLDVVANRATLSYSRLAEESVDSEIDLANQEGEVKIVDEAKVEEIFEPREEKVEKDAVTVLIHESVEGDVVPMLSRKDLRR